MQEESKLIFSNFEEASAYARHISFKYKVVKISREKKTANWAVSLSVPIENNNKRLLRTSETTQIKKRQISNTKTPALSSILKRLENIQKSIENNKIKDLKMPNQEPQNAKAEKIETPKPTRNNSIKGGIKNTRKLSPKERRKISDDEKNRILQTAKNRSSSLAPRFERGGISDYEEGYPRPGWIPDKD
jgi:hypothetical protein